MEVAAVPSLGAIFGVFLRLGMASFGGGLPGWMHHEVVRQRKWLDEERFMAGLALGQVLPGPNSVNLALYIGQRLRGLPGAAAAFLGILGRPFLFILALAAAQARIADLPLMAAALGGVAAAGLANSCAVGALVARRVRGAGLWSVAVATFVAVGLLHLPMIPVVLVLAPIGIGLVWREARAGWGLTGSSPWRRFSRLSPWCRSVADHPSSPKCSANPSRSTAGSPPRASWTYSRCPGRRPARGH